MTWNVLLVPDCGSGVGLGHLERVLALADALPPDAVATVVLPAADRGLRDRVDDRGHLAVAVAGSTAARAVASAAAEPPPDVVVLDGYVFDVATQELLRARSPLVVVDDLAHRCSCDLAVNPSPGGDAARPAGADRFLGGAPYALISAAVVQARAVPPSGDRRVLVSTGATDPLGVTRRVVTGLLAGDPGVEVVAVAGPETAFSDLPADPRLTILVAPLSLAGALAAAAVYAGAAGTTAVQAACVGVAAVITPVAANQRDQASALATAGCALVEGPDDLAAACLLLLDDGPRRTAMGRAGRELVDGRGADRLATALRGLVRAPVTS